ncbi:glycine cleavage T-C-terminal barrel domain protein [Candidatus Endolissoclinum faulkneri L2]|uniref:Glycine cleavage T-C-terminal barrel domain protein n=1 Tax=Candidatus Endolissoclinum faulkneri L2 TaxID=1193729 RepID=K7ZDI6_9PROT|nr:folate-binding protein YgfZ [Candidatus Endolissoclinum faulkneri]AFX99556.1 glycine cleavage T-C-terminal barrel domain protein [Candidatus Endolissoclinum faulkneri L2]
MAEAYFHILDDRGIIRVAGEDRVQFLQNLVSNDVFKVTPESTGYGALLTTQGKFLHDFFLININDALLIDTAADRLQDFFCSLQKYKLRSKIELSIDSKDWILAAIFGRNALDLINLPAKRGATSKFDEGFAFIDPRHINAGIRILCYKVIEPSILKTTKLQETDRESYERHRISLGLPDGAKDMTVKKTLLLEAGFEELGGIDFQKGCYIGQELTARTKYRGLVKRRLMPININGSIPKIGTKITLNGRDIGEVRSVVADRDSNEVKGIGLAMIRIDSLKSSINFNHQLIANEAIIKPYKPDWGSF